ncbi:MAG: ATP-binding cassette domain-containing protein [Acidimicrobiia bacterium]|nr:ATP-binding cassette domain-containing protein [Acidimicrobiia bacterium]
MAGSGTAHLRGRDEALLRIEDLVVEFPVGRRGLKVHAVSNVSLDVLPGETLGIVGESGCGKSTMGKAVMQLVTARSGSVTFDGKELTKLSGALLRETRPKLQMIFQDPISSLNPRRRVRDIVREGLDIWKIGDKESRVARVNEVLDTVGIDPAVAGPKRPHEFSGGQCQRISIARAVATEPKLIICDEPVSALDVSVQAQILNLLEEMKKRYGLTLIFIAHDLAVVKNVSDKVAVLYLGKLCEFADPDTLYAEPAHPYTAALLSAIPEPDPDAESSERAGVGGEIPSPLSPPSGCRFRTRCPAATDVCSVEEPMMREVRPRHFVACHHPLGAITVTAATPVAVTPPPPPAPEPPSPEPPVVAPAVFTPAPEDAAATPDPWLAVAPVTAAAEPLAPVDWSPEPATPEPPVPEVVPPPPPPPRRRHHPSRARYPRALRSPPPPPPPAPAPTPPPAAVSEPTEGPAAAPEAPEAGEEPPSSLPDTASLDTLLPKRSRGGSIKPPN